MNHGFWILQPYVYVLPGAHVEWHGLWPQVLVWMTTVVFAIALLVILRAIEKHSTRAALTIAILGGLMIGGAIANSLEIAALGAVTDFIGIRAAGIYSAGDIGLDIAIALLPVAAVQLLAGRPTPVRVLCGLGVAIADVLYAATSDRPGLLVAYMVIPVALLSGFWTLAMRTLADRSQAASTQASS